MVQGPVESGKAVDQSARQLWIVNCPREVLRVGSADPSNGLNGTTGEGDTPTKDGGNGRSVGIRPSRHDRRPPV